jgi:hypothetical protein
MSDDELARLRRLAATLVRVMAYDSAHLVAYERTNEVDALVLWDALVAAGLAARVVYDPARHGRALARPGEEVFWITDAGRALLAEGVPEGA